MDYTFPTLSLIGSNTDVADTPLVSTIPSTNSEKSPLLLPKTHNLLISANPENHYLIEKRKLQLLASTCYWKNYLNKRPTQPKFKTKEPYLVLLIY